MGSLPSWKAYAESLNEISFTDGSYAEKATLDFTTPAAGDYLIFVQCMIRGSSTSYSVYQRAQLDDTTTFMTNQVRPATTAGTTDYRSAATFYLASSLSQGAHYVDIDCYRVTSGTGYIKNIRILVFRYDDWLSTSGMKGYVATEASVSITGTSRASPTTVQTLTFTPDTTDDYLILGYSELVVNSTSYSAYLLLNDATGAEDIPIQSGYSSATYDYLGEESRTTADRIPCFWGGIVNLASGASRTVYIYGIRESTSGSPSAYCRRILAIRLGALDSEKQSNESTTETSGTNTSYSTSTYKSQISWSPTYTRNWLIIGAMGELSSSTSYSVASKLVQTAGTGAADINEAIMRAKQVLSTGATDTRCLSGFVMKSLASGTTQTFQTEYRVDSGTTIYVRGSVIVAFPMEAPSGSSSQPAQVTVWNTGKNDQPAQVTVYQWSTSNQPAQVQVFAVGAKDQPAQVTVWTKDLSDQEAQVTVTEALLQGSSDQLAQVTAYGKDSNSQPAQVTVWSKGTSDQPAQVSVWTTGLGNQPAQVNVYQGGSGSQPCQVTVWTVGSGNQPCQVTVWAASSQPAQVTVYGKSSSSQPCQVTVWSKAAGDQSCQVSVWTTGKNDQPCQVTVCQYDKSSQPVQVTVYDWWRTNQPAQVQVVSASGLSSQPARVTVFGSEASNQPAQVSVWFHDYSSQHAQVTISTYDTSSRQAQVFVYAVGTSDQEGQVTVWNRVGADQYCCVEIAGAVTLSGIVTNAWGTPLKDVEIKLFDANLNRVAFTKTDASGYFEIEVENRGFYHLNAYRSGRERLAYLLNLNTSGDVDFEDVIVDATSPGEGAGPIPYTEVVTDDEGTPIPRVAVRVWARLSGEPYTTLVARDKTDATGKYTVYLYPDVVHTFRYAKPRYKFKEATRRINCSAQPCQIEVTT